MTEDYVTEILTAAGRPAAPASPRLVWYSARCRYWTDDPDKLMKFGPGIPCYPECGSPGYRTEAARFRVQEFPVPPRESCDGSRLLTS